MGGHAQEGSQGLALADVEGHVSRIKMLKRQMYGRADPDLLRRRVLLADQPRKGTEPVPEPKLLT